MASTQPVATEIDQPVSFLKPPVNEVYISMQTKEPSFPSDNFGELVQIYGTQYPKLNAQPKLDRNIEREDVSVASIQFELMSNLGQRFWLISQDDTRVLQIQDDRFVLNWRQRGDAAYPRYHAIRDEFKSAISKMIEARGLNADDLIDFCEVSYTNHLELPDGRDPRAEMHRIFRHVRPVTAVDSHLHLEETAFNFSFRIIDEGGKFLGRMRVQTHPAIVRKDRRFVFQAVLNYRGMPETPALESALAFCDAGHIAIVRSFEAMTTDEMHTFWGKQ